MSVWDRYRGRKIEKQREREGAIEKEWAREREKEIENEHEKIREK